MKKATKPADMKSAKEYQDTFGKKTSEVYESTLIDRVIN
jgi:hypothetical protein